MSARLMYTLFALCGLLLLAAALWLPVDLGFAAPVPTKQGSDLAVLPGDCALFMTVRPSDLVNNPLAKAFTDQTRMFEGMERSLGVGQPSIERITFANVGGELVTIIRTSKAYEKSKVLETLDRGRSYGFKDKGFKDKEPEKPQLIEKKVGGKSVHFYSNPESRFPEQARWTQAVGIVDRNVFVRGNLVAVEELFGSKVKQTEELAGQISLAGKHSIVAGFQGKALRSALRRDARRYTEERKRYSKDFRGKDDSTEGEKPAKKEDKEDDSVELSTPGPLLVFKPFIVMKSAVITADISKSYKVTAQITFDNAEATDDGETAVKMMLYLLREFAVMAPKSEREFKPLAPLSEPLQKVFKGAKIKRKGNTLETSISLTVEDGVVKKVTDEIAAEKKREEERMKKYRDKEKKEFRDFRDKRKD